MKSLKNYLIEFCRDEEGLTTVEYAVAGALISIAVVAGFRSLGNQINNTLGEIETAITPPTTNNG